MISMYTPLNQEISAVAHMIPELLFDKAPLEDPGRIQNIDTPNFGL